MKKLLPVLFLVLVPTLAWSQGSLLVSSVSGKVEIKPVSATAFSPLTPSLRIVHFGDVIQTGPDATVTLTFPDTSYLMISPGSRVVIQDFWSGSSLRGVVNVALGRVRFWVAKFGGRASPRLETPTALIAVRGTIFDVFFDGQTTEVECIEGSVAVVNVADPNGVEAVLLPGKKTFVNPGQPPSIPIARNETFPNREFQVIKKSPSTIKAVDMPSLGELARDNDRMNRPSDRMQSPGSQTDPTVARAKSSVTFPE